VEESEIREYLDRGVREAVKRALPRDHERGSRGAHLCGPFRAQRGQG
jgi:hypothetical protein